MQLAFIAIGGNQPSVWGTPEETVTKAVEHLGDLSAGEMRVSGFYETPAFPAGSGPEFVNAAVSIMTDLSPAVLLEKLHEIEALAKRTRTQRWGQRTLDLDLIGVGQSILPDAETQRHWQDLPMQDQLSQTPAELILPHPRLQDRGFVLVPLADVAPDWVHPVLGATVRHLLEALPVTEVESVVPIDKG